MNNLNEMFTTATTETTATNGRSLEGTAQLVEIANREVANAFVMLGEDTERYQELFDESKVSHTAMDRLLESFVAYDNLELDFLKELPDETVVGMLKSQQSKRSRAKSKQMTMDNYKSMMCAAICEGMIRFATDKPKSAGGARSNSGRIVFDAEQLAELTEDQDKLRKEIRNVQSKKSIMKSKAGFTVSDERWTQLLKAEAQLKAIRLSTSNTITVDTTKNKLHESLSEVDIDHLNAADSKSLLKTLAQLLED